MARRGSNQPDDEGAYLFRARVAQNMAPMGWVTRANAIKGCGEAGVKLRCSCGQAHLVPFRCGARSCPSCAKIVAAQKVARIANRARIALESLAVDDRWDGKGAARRKSWKLFTGTSRANPFAGDRFAPDVLIERIRRVRGAWGPFWRSTPWGARIRLLADRVDAETGEVIGVRWTRRARRDTAAAMGIEVAPGGMVHLHAAVYGEFVESDTLAALWSDALGERAFIKIRGMKSHGPADFDKALREVLKYVTKWDKLPGSREQRAAAIEIAMRNVRRVEMIGFIRGMAAADALLEPPVAEACGTCGKTDWQWIGIWTPEKVRLNSGFGPVTAAIDDAERREWRKHPARSWTEAQRILNEELLNSANAADVADPTIEQDQQEAEVYDG